MSSSVKLVPYCSLIFSMITVSGSRFCSFRPASPVMGRKPFLGARQLDGAFVVLFQPVVLQKHLVIHLYRLMAALGQKGSEELGVYAEFVNLPVKEPAYLRDKGIDAVEPRQG